MLVWTLYGRTACFAVAQLRESTVLPHSTGRRGTDESKSIESDLSDERAGSRIA